ncbi:cytochrome P460 [Chryseobacterium carnipullorum]|uniref:Cytochrome P460 n=2 Tax=Chryseobacterium carnipullorum TaxID=1124835 RepID=A0A3G6LUN7_CHRCU|nr:heme-binding domain-containing protein [Chryseobacterium carnipullorum]AZA46970.1 cytochrome P460 [Chryseobacterium carnipullorum]AZA66322.1 cytochrome P460 [Chryseobacterium carnipullorum]HBV16350.1 cytochrome P460 [Chryseobacterium carnipullorum]
MKNKMITTGLVITGIFALMQLYRPKIDKGHHESQKKVFPHDVQVILKNSCYDCHSNQQNLKWFDQIAPANWIVADDVNRAKSVLNFSEFDQLQKSDQNTKIWGAVNKIMLGAMPLKSYLTLHPEAKVSNADLEKLKKYALTLAPEQKKDTAKDHKLNLQYAAWRDKEMKTPQKSPVAVNGIAYIPEYKNWTPISTTQRIDNGTLRIIFGNNIAIQAIKEHHTNPWPDGSIIAKVNWESLTTPDGNISPGAFRAVEYMIKDRKKYASTKGWGWARFLTTDLKPYGNDESFTKECVNCHTPVANTDYVFTLPMQH